MTRRCIFVRRANKLMTDRRLHALDSERAGVTIGGGFFKVPCFSDLDGVVKRRTAFHR